VNYLLSTASITHRLVPCPECNAKISLRLLTNIRSLELLMESVDEHYNYAICPCCHTPVMSPERVRIEIPDSGIPAIEYIPIALTEDPQVLDEILQATDSVHFVYSLADQLGSFIAFARLANHLNAQKEAKLIRGHNTAA
jgi:hypothetical protein